jgi:hypothetical protein
MQPKTLISTVAIIALALTSSGRATDPSGVVSNVMLAPGPNHHLPKRENKSGHRVGRCT